MAREAFSNQGLGARIWQRLLEIDNTIIGLFICAFAIYDWITFYDGINNLNRYYYSQGLYALPSLSILSVLCSGIYLTFASIILLSLRQPLSRYRTVFPNLAALLAGFGVYIFVWVPGGSLLGLSVYFALALIILGTVIIIVSLFYLRQAFTVTPQARFLVTDGPYSFIRHPMYAGNIISLAGLTVLIDSFEAVVLFLICSGLQVCRAIYEEKLLQQKLSGYSDYKRRVGGFIPRITFNKRAVKRTLVYVACLLGFGLADTETIRVVADPAANWAKKCDNWYKQATSKHWFTADQARELARVDSANSPVDLDSIQGCQQFVDLNQKCSNAITPWSAKELSANDFLNQIEATSGCVYMAGMDNVCAAIKSLLDHDNHRLSEGRLDLWAECTILSARNRMSRVQFSRPAL